MVDALKEYPAIKVCTVVGFPHGNVPAPLKLEQAEYFAERGINEIDFVINIGLLKSGMYDNVGDEMEAIGSACKERGVISKCLVETCYLTEHEKTFLFKSLYERTQVDYIKTSTGYGTAGAQLSDVLDWKTRQTGCAEAEKGPLIQLLPTDKEQATRNSPLLIKAAGGIKDLKTALQFIEGGADRLGMSASVKVMEEWNAHNRVFTFAEGEEKAGTVS
jgi:deoxyribose-phosphate aldolase